jgi:leucyl aminopeptidase
MRIRFAAAQPAGEFALALPVRKGADFPTNLPGLDTQGAALARAAGKAARFEGDVGGTAELVVAAGADARRVVLFGLGDKDESAAWEKAGGALSARLLVSGEKIVVVDLTGSVPRADDVARLALGAVLRSWRHDVYRTKLPEKSRPTLEEIVIVGAPEGAETAWADQQAVAEGVALTRTLVTEPANIIYPESFVERCRHLADLGVEIEVLDKAEMTKLGMGALLGVAQGSVNEARLLVLRWDGTNGADTTPLAFVGKGVTFDTGGISIKPAAGMEDMKFDMGGAGAVVGAIKALALRKAKAHVVGVCGLVENMPDGNAQRPGDVVTSMSGQTIEVINTDAEGRLVLCDALTWVQRKYQPNTVVDLATLTGAMLIALGNEYAGMFTNDDSLADGLVAAGKASGEPLWRFPLGDAYNKMIDSPIADMKNVGSRYAGSITAAQFLQRFIEDGVAWAHLDIAGMVWADKPGATWDKGATGYGVRLIDAYVRATVEAQG